MEQDNKTWTQSQHIKPKITQSSCELKNNLKRLKKPKLNIVFMYAYCNVFMGKKKCTAMNR